jgi:hypothetical protein
MLCVRTGDNNFLNSDKSESDDIKKTLAIIK